MRKTKIICTLGPSSKDREILKEMLQNGMNVARINLSHGDKDSHGEIVDRFRKVRDALGLPAAVLFDTRGPEIRVGDFKDKEITLKDGDSFTFTTKDIIGTEKIVSVTYKDFAKDLKAGSRVLVDDGKISLVVDEIKGMDVICTVINGGKISDHKGINIPDVNLTMDYLNHKDKEDLLFGIEKDIDYVAASFVRSKDDVVVLRNFLDKNGGESIKIISKIESIEGVKNFKEILDFSDGIMIARGDMGVEVPFETLPGIQKKFIRKCLKYGKIVITATQMLDSMMNSPMPTRAEITDVANAVFDGTTAIMLSGETASGKYPVESVKVMSKIALKAEEDEKYLVNHNIWHEIDSKDVTNAIGHAACTIARDIEAAGIMAITKTGYTAGRMSKFRPKVTIIGATPHEKTYHQMSLMHGVAPLMANYRKEMNELLGHFARKAIREGIIEDGDKIVISAGLPVDVKGNTNFIKVVTARLDRE